MFSGSCGARRFSTNCVLRCATRSSTRPGACAASRTWRRPVSFLVPLDRRRGWYRYHALFREFLLAELQRVEPDVIAKLHLRAADWYESNGSPALALEHLLNTTERDALRPTGDPVDLADLSGRPARHRATVALHPRPPCYRGASPARRPGRMGRGADRRDRRRATVGGLPRHRLVRPAPRRRHGIVQLGAGHAAGADVCRRTEADGDRREFGRRRGTALEPMARRGVVLVCRGAAHSSATVPALSRSSTKPEPSRQHSATSALLW